MKGLKCSNCGEQLENNYCFCTKCGNKVQKEKKEKSSKKYVVFAIISTYIVSSLLFGSIYLLTTNNEKLTANISEGIKNVNIIDNGISEAVNKVYDSVVVVETYVNGNIYSTGTGFVFKTDNKKGYILTNNHVIENNTEVYVIFTNEKKVKVDIVGKDEFSDIAVLSLDKNNVISIANIGSNKNINIGDTVFAVGAPIDAKAYSWTVTRGILSGKNRIVETEDSVMEVMQTDAAINNGNSGGPLCNSNGEVIGITNMKLASSTIEGMGFAIPIENAINYANKFINNEKIERPFVGISIQNYSNNYFNNTSDIYVVNVMDNSPAKEAGLNKGDKILKVNDVEITGTARFKYEIYKQKVGDTITITYERNNKEYTTKLKLGSN